MKKGIERSEHMAIIDVIAEEIGYRFKDEALLEQAFSHTSYINERRGTHIDSYERLEFLGDAILEYVVSKYLYKEYPQEPEGKLTRIRAALVCETSLAYLARLWHFDDLMYLGKGEEASGGRKRPSILCDIFEAFIGAFVLDAGIERVIPFIEEQIVTLRDQSDIRLLDYKTLLQEELQTHGKVLIQYHLLRESGPSHKKTFEVEVSCDGKNLGQGQGASKKEAEQEAARLALKRMGKME